MTDSRAGGDYGQALNMINALACFAFVAGYLYSSAIPTYNTPIWEAGVDFRQDLPVPAFAFLITRFSVGAAPNVYVRGDRGLPNGTPLEAVFDSAGDEEQYPPGSVQVINKAGNGTFTAYYANPSNLSSTFAKTSQFSSLSDAIEMDLDLYCTHFPAPLKEFY